jgi:hypothetical protein
MNFAHIFKVKNGWQVVIGSSPDLRGSENVIAEVVLTSKAEAGEVCQVYRRETLEFLYLATQPGGCGPPTTRRTQHEDTT